jgi:hypothetical protein
MPVVVDEVVISVEVTNQAAGGAAEAPSKTEERQQLLSECVEKVLDILEQQQER